MNRENSWPALPFEDFKSTAHLLHMGVQLLGKLKLYTAFEPHWGNVILLPTSSGITTGPIPYQGESFQINIDLIHHEIELTTSSGKNTKFALTTTSVAKLTQRLLNDLQTCGIKPNISLKPQEIPSPIPFDQDTSECFYDPDLANAWWRILLSSYQVLQIYHSRFHGETPPVGLMWGTFDLRDARYNGKPVPTTGANAGFIRRNAMDEEQIEVGWWHGNDAYPRPAYYAFTYPQPEGIEKATLKSKTARWVPELGEFILDYDAIRNGTTPEKDLLEFFESSYQIGSQLAGWDNFITSGKPV